MLRGGSIYCLELVDMMPQTTFALGFNPPWVYAAEPLPLDNAITSYLSAHAPARLKLIAIETNAYAGSVCYALKRLERKGLVVRDERKLWRMK